jgi:amino acid transporter
VFKATRIVIFGFFGFECASSLFTIVHDPARNVPRALTYSILIVGSVYTLFIASIIASTPLNLFTDARIPVSETLALVFPEHPWLITIIHFAILSAIIGTIHSMIWSSSHLFVSILKQCKNKIITHLVSAQIINNKTSVLLVGSAIAISYMTFTSLNLFFSLTAIFLIFAFTTSMITLLTIPSEWRSGRNIVTILGIATALLMFIFAMQGFITELGIL